MESRAERVTRFFVSMCDVTEIMADDIYPEDARAGQQIGVIRTRVSEFFCDIFEVYDIRQVDNETLIELGVNPPLLYGLLDTLSEYVGKQAESAIDEFLTRYHEIPFSEDARAAFHDTHPVRLSTVRLFFAFHHITQSCFGARTDRRLKPSVAEQIVDDLVIDALEKGGYVMPPNMCTHPDTLAPAPSCEPDVTSEAPPLPAEIPVSTTTSAEVCKAGTPKHRSTNKMKFRLKYHKAAG